MTNEKQKSPDFFVGDCISIPMADNSVDLVFGSPPYEDARTYGIDYGLKGNDWVEWCLPRMKECLRISKGLVAWVLTGRTKNYEYSCTPEKLIAALSDADWCTVRKPCIYKRQGIPGTGGPDWFRADYETIVCITKGGKLRWSNNTACGKKTTKRPDRMATNRNTNGTRKQAIYKDPERSNPGDIVDCGNAGSSMGSGRLFAAQNEAPFPESLAERFVLSFCPPGGVVFDPFLGSGTTAAVCLASGRKASGMDIRQSQIDLTIDRLAKQKNPLTHRSNSNEQRPALFQRRI